MPRSRYIKGDPNVICDRCGFKRKYSQTRKEWNGLRVCVEEWEARHPQDKLRGIIDKQSFPDPRPEGEDIFITPNEVTAENL